MNTLKKIWSNKWVRFGVVSAIYILWFVVWAENPWMLLGVAVIYDIYISKIMYRLFWKRHKERKAESKSYRKTAEWVETIIFAVVVASIIRTFVFSMYVIPTGSMEKSLLVGDYLYVSKVAYGPQRPNTPLSFPLVHNMMPLSSTKSSFVTWIQRPYKRFRGLGSVKRGDAVVFNFPEGDTVALANPQASYHDMIRRYERDSINGRELIWQNSRVIYRPVDKRENYIKRAIGVPGDSIRIVAGEVFVNGQLQEVKPGMQFAYIVRTNGNLISEESFRRLGIANDDILYSSAHKSYELPLTQTNVERIKELGNVTEVVRLTEYAADPNIFPHSPLYPWNVDNFGPIWVPKKGATVRLDMASLPLYHRIIETYESNKLEVKNGTIYINGQPATEYTFAMDYYFMMGDNRHRSSDSRYWGFVPEDHVVGKASFVWFSTDKDRSGFSKIRWKRLFITVK